MSQPSENNSSLLISYLSLRKAVGVIGIALPVVLVLGNWQLFHSRAFEDSISYYYYTGMRGVLVGESVGDWHLPHVLSGISEKG